MQIHIASDHAGLIAKEYVQQVLESLGHEVIDYGANDYDKDDDYPDFIRPAAQAVGEAYLSGKTDVRGIIFGGSGQGEAIVANRVPGVRAAVWYGGDMRIILLSREHNDANMLSLGARFMDKGIAEEAVKTWLDTPFSNDDRHIRRIKKIDQ
jgi:ribose 5-phosphate isomerase B